MDFSKALHLINTVEEKELLLNELETLGEELYVQKGSASKKIQARLSHTNQQAIQTLIEANKVKDDDIMGVQQLIKNYIEYLNGLPVVSMTIAFEPKAGDVESIYSWFLANVKKKVLLDLTVDESIIGGAVIAHEGYYQDLSLKKRIETMKL